MTYKSEKDEDIIIGNNNILYKDLYKFLFRNSKINYNHKYRFEY